jgi:hypothetical protein
MRGLGLLLAIDALDLAQRASHGSRRSPGVLRPATTTPDGEPSDALNDMDSEARLAAWRAWARRRDTGWEPPAVEMPARRGQRQGAPATSR